MFSAGAADGRPLRAADAAAAVVLPLPPPLVLDTNTVSPTAVPRRLLLLPSLDGHSGDVPPNPGRRSCCCAGAVVLLLLHLRPAAIAEKEKASTDRLPTQSKAEAVAAALATRLVTLIDRNLLRRLMTRRAKSGWLSISLSLLRNFCVGAKNSGGLSSFFWFVVGGLLSNHGEGKRDGTGLDHRGSEQRFFSLVCSAVLQFTVKLLPPV